MNLPEHIPEQQPRASARPAPARACRPSETARCERVRAPAHALADQRGDTLIEVLAASLILALIAVATFTGLTTAHRFTAIERARSQADAIAQSNEEQLRSEPATHLLSLDSTHEVTEQGTVYEPGKGYKGTIFTLVEKGEVIRENGSTSCGTESGSFPAPYVRTISEVTWQGAASRRERVVETGIVNPPPSTMLVVRITNRKAEPLANMSLSAHGPSPETTLYSTTTSASGCAILELEHGGEYAVNANRLGYVDQDWYANVNEDPFYSKGVVRLVDAIATPRYYRFDEPGKIAVHFVTRLYAGEETVPGEALNAVAANAEVHPEVQRIQRATSTSCPGEPLDSYSGAASTGVCVFPFESPYAVYAGTCAENAPEHFGGRAKELPVAPNAVAEATLQVPAVIAQVWSGNATEKKSSVTPPLYIKQVPPSKSAECDKTIHPVERLTATTASHGLVSYISAAFGEGYTLCTQWEHNGRKFSSRLTLPTLDNLNEAVNATLYENSNSVGSVSTPLGEDKIVKEACS